MQRFIYVTLPVLIGILAFSTWLINAGDLNPPPGPIMATNRVQLNAQSVSLPITISSPGSYVLTSDFTGVSGNHGIVIDTDDVTLDLNGFSLVGVPGSQNGVIAASGHKNIAVLNGSVRDWGQSGVSVFDATGCRVTGLLVSNNALTGLEVGDAGVVRDCSAVANGQRGIHVRFGVTISHCSARQNEADGFVVAAQTNISYCSATGNGGNGFDILTGSTVTACLAGDNGEVGILTAVGCRVSGCTVRGNDVAGVQTDGSLIADCKAFANGGPGILAEFRCRIVGNHCNNNVPGISVTGRWNRIEGNSLVGSGTGLSVNNSDNIILKNTAGNNGINYVLSIGNSYGPIVNVAGVGDISVVPNANHPWANFEHQEGTMRRAKTEAILAAMAAFLLATNSLIAQSNIDNNHKFSWGENVGWMNWRDAGGGSDGVFVHIDHMEGLIWGENSGWINVGNGGGPYANTDGFDFGVNLDPITGFLMGFAWGENIGWLNFDTSGLGADRARLDPTTLRFHGYAWGENAGWISLDDSQHFVAILGGGNDFIRGDADGNGIFNGLVDGIFILNYQFTGGSSPPCLESADADGNGVFNGLVDGVFVLNHQFVGGPPPPAPYPDCGPDPDPGSSLGCGPNACP